MYLHITVCIFASTQSAVLMFLIAAYTDVYIYACVCTSSAGKLGGRMPEIHLGPGE